MTKFEKYEEAVRTLREIANCTGADHHGHVDDWSKADAFENCRSFARRTLQRIGETGDNGAKTEEDTRK